MHAVVQLTGWTAAALAHIPGVEHILIIGGGTGGAESATYQASARGGVVGVSVRGGDRVRLSGCAITVLVAELAVA